MSPGTKIARGTGAAIVVGLIVLSALLIGDMLGGGR